MAKRFTDTNKYKKAFVRSLPGAYKLFWDFLYHDCDHSGIWIIDFDIAQTYIGKDMQISKEEALKLFNSDEIRIVEISGGKKWFIPSFIEFQYGHLSEKNRAHNSVILSLNKLGLLNEDLSIKNSQMGLVSPLQGGKDKAQEQDKDKEQEQPLLKNNGFAVYNAEVEILKNQIELERICMTVNMDIVQAKEALHKYHLFLEEREHYPRGKKAIFAGFEKWLINEKKFSKNGARKENRFVGKHEVNDKL